MFVWNVKLNGKKLVKIILVIIAIAITIYFAIATYMIYSNSFKVNDELNNTNIINISTNNYTNILKSVHDDIDSFIGKEICFSGYVYRLLDFKETEFVLARDMIISSDMQTLIVGFLCDCKDAQSFEDNSWVEIKGEITKGSYHGDIPVIKIKEFKQIEKPQDDIYVYPPDDTYVPTSTLF